MAFTFGSRTTGEGVRLVLKQEIFIIPDQEQQLAERIRAGKALREDHKEYERLYESRGKEFFSRGPEAFFEIQKIDLELPPKAPRAPSDPCEVCGEMVMQTKLAEVNGHKICKGCRVTI